MADWRNRMEQITNKVKCQLFAKGVDNLEQLRDVFMAFDVNQNGALEVLEFEEFMSKLGVFLTKQELRTVYDHFDHNKDGQVTYSEFLGRLKTDMSDDRCSIVKRAWQHLSKGASAVPFEAMVNCYNAPAHPRVTSREKKADTVFNDFVHLMGAHQKNGQVCEEGFVSYYSDANAVLPAERDSYFIDMILKTWNINSDVANVPEARCKELEDIIFEKIRQRTHGADDEGKTVRRIFKHFDLNGNGTIDINEFVKALETLGCVFKDYELRAIFNKHDADNSGMLDYEEFANWCAIRGSGNNPNVNPAFGATREPPNQVMDKIRATLKARGAHGIRGLGLVFRRMDNNGDKKLDRTEFMWGLKENGHNLSPSEFERIFKYFDKNSCGKINFDEFLRAARGNMNEFRRGFVDQAFKKLDKTGDGVVTIDDLIGVYDVSFHKDFKAGTASKEDILTDFLAQWDKHEQDSKITREEFHEYYNDVSASLDNDEHFGLMMKNAWKLDC